MPGPSTPLANTGYLPPALVHCPVCDVPRPMHINGVKPALYCGKDTIFYQCTTCGNETTERVASEEGPSGESEIQWLSLTYAVEIETRVRRLRERKQVAR